MLRRYMTETDVPERVIKGHQKLHGYMVNVTDGDTFRFYHVPLARWLLTKRPEEKARGVSKDTICVRLSAVDAPEMPHFGNPEQPLAREAKECLYKQLTGRPVTIKPLAKDQYGRIVATVTYRNLWVFKKNAAHEMLRSGLATLYT
ncbi:putative endonuclease lcl3, partial [Coemansia sp. RSA 1933]